MGAQVNGQSGSVVHPVLWNSGQVGRVALALMVSAYAINALPIATAMAGIALVLAVAAWAVRAFSYATPAHV